MCNTKSAKLQATRIERARATRRFYEIQPVKEGDRTAYYIVRNPKGELYQVSRTGCGCPDGIALVGTGVMCKHEIMVREWFAEEKARKAQRAAERKALQDFEYYDDGEFVFRLYPCQQAA